MHEQAGQLLQAVSVFKLADAMQAPGRSAFAGHGAVARPRLA